LAQGYLKLQCQPNRLPTFPVGSLDRMVHPIVSMSPRKGRWLNKNTGSSGAQSRSTSAGSVPSESQGSTEPRRASLSSDELSRKSSMCSVDPPLEKSSAQDYPGKMLGLPEYDYPTPWSIAEAPKLAGTGFPAPLVVKNTFVNFEIGRPVSLEEFF